MTEKSGDVRPTHIMLEGGLDGSNHDDFVLDDPVVLTVFENDEPQTEKDPEMEDLARELGIRVVYDQAEEDADTAPAATQAEADELKRLIDAMHRRIGPEDGLQAS